MIKWVMYVVLLFCSCGINKEKNQLKRDALSNIKTTVQWEIEQQWNNSEYQFKDINNLQAVWIKADAPFKWQLDSGLNGKAGNYQLYFLNKGKSMVVQRREGEQKIQANHKKNQKEEFKSVKEKKLVSSLRYKFGIMVVLIVLIGLFFYCKKNCFFV